MNQQYKSIKKFNQNNCQRKYIKSLTKIKIKIQKIKEPNNSNNKRINKKQMKKKIRKASKSNKDKNRLKKKRKKKIKRETRRNRIKNNKNRAKNRKNRMICLQTKIILQMGKNKTPTNNKKSSQKNK